MIDGKLTHFWVIADILQKRYGMPTSYEIGVPWQPVTFAWSRGRGNLYIEARNEGECEHVNFLLVKNGECVLRKGVMFYSEDTDVENLRYLFRKLGSADLQPMWDFLEANFRNNPERVSGKPIEAIHHDDVIKGDI